MNRFRTNPIGAAGAVAILLTLGAATAWPQDTNSGWRKFGDDSQAPAAAPADPAPPQLDAQQTQPPIQAPAGAQTNAPQTQPQMQPPATPDMPSQPNSYGLPPELTVKDGVYLSVRLNDQLSSNRNHPGDTFSATLAQPLVVDGVIVAARGQTVFGRVVDAQKSTSNSPSRLGVELDEITLVDGEQAPLRTQLTNFDGRRTPAGQQTNTILTTTALGTMVGSAAARGTGAAIGAGAGALAGTVAVLMTHHQPTVLYPETAMTFRIESPFTVSTVRAPQAFRYAGPNDYNHPVETQALDRRPAPRCYGCAPPVWGPVYGPYPYYYGPGYYAPSYYGPGYYGPNYYGPGFGVVIGRGYGRRW